MGTSGKATLQHGGATLRKWKRGPGGLAVSNRKHPQFFLVVHDHLILFTIDPYENFDTVLLGGLHMTGPYHGTISSGAVVFS